MRRPDDPYDRRRRRPAWDALPTGSYLISTRPPSQHQLWIARLLGVAALAVFGGMFAFRDVQLAKLDAFVPIANTIIIINDGITAALLFTQYSVTRHRALLVLATGFLFRALIFIPHTLTFPGAFAPAGLLGARLQTTAWLYQTQQFAFLVTAIGYTILRDRPVREPASESRPARAIVVSIAAAVTAVAIVTLVTIVGAEALPAIMGDLLRTSDGFRRVGHWPLYLLASGSILVFRRRPTSIMDLWLQVAVWSWVFEALSIAIIPARFSLVFYMGRTLGVVASAFVLVAFLSESLMLQRRLLLETAAREHARRGQRTAIDIVVNSLSHELRQPLTSILVNETAGSKLLAGGPGAQEEVAAVFADIRGSVVRANEIIGSVRDLFAASLSDRRAIDVGALTNHAVELMRIELETHRIVIDLQLSPALQPIHGHPGQLLEVLLNALQNALDSLGGESDRPRHLCIRTTALEAGRIAIDIEDSGGGIDPRVRHRLFEPFQSTKPGGMGLGLSICQSIVLAHGGTLSLEPRAPHGAVFRVELPTSPAVRADRADVPWAQAAAYAAGGASLMQ